ncbi:MAG TPA: fatty acid desaturase [Tepidisphaeraceae bacterium]|jgi:fatty acid desaturase
MTYVCAAGLTTWLITSQRHTHAINIACIPLYLLAAASLHGISLFTHEAVHGTLCKSRFWNNAGGSVCAWPVLQNFAAYQVLHLRHHDHLGLPGDPDHYSNYTRWSWLVFAMNWGRLILGYPAYIIAIPILGFRQGRGWERFWIVFETGCVIAMVSVAVLSPIPRTVLIHGWLIPMLFINTLVNIRGMSQHTLLEHQSDPILGTRSILTNRVTAFFMCNENYHLEHHIYPGVPWYNLPRLHRALKQDLTQRGAPYIGSYFAFVWAFVTGSIRRSPLGSRR